MHFIKVFILILIVYVFVLGYVPVESRRGRRIFWTWSSGIVVIAELRSSSKAILSPTAEPSFQPQ